MSNNASNILCTRCQEPGTLRRIGTAYVDDAKNYAVVCDLCLEELAENIEHRWREYTSEIAASLSDCGVRWSHSLTPIDGEWI